jgi:hypothetical protein
MRAQVPSFGVQLAPSKLPGTRAACRCMLRQRSRQHVAHRPAHTNRQEKAASKHAGRWGCEVPPGLCRASQIDSATDGATHATSKNVEGASEDIKIIWSRLVKARPLVAA